MKRTCLHTLTNANVNELCEVHPTIKKANYLRMKHFYFIIIACLISLSAPAQMMLGEIRVFAGSSLPSYGWVLCDGRTLSVSSYSSLFTILGTTYGGDGITTFAVPNLCGRVPVGAGQGTDLLNYSLGLNGGSATITYTAANLPAHTHTVTINGSADAADADTPVGTLPATTSSNAYTTTADGSMAAESFSVTVGSDGSGAAQNNMQPYLGLNYMIAIYGSYQIAEEPYLGEIRLYAGSTIPTGWLACDGSSLSILQNQSLYTLLGTTYGATSSTFNLPDLRSRIPINRGTNSSVNYEQGTTGGEESQTLTEAQMAVHSHTTTASMQVYSGVGNANTPIGNYPAINPQRGNEFTTTTTSSSTTATVTSEEIGSGAPVSNLQPFCTIQYIICTSGNIPSRP